MQINSGFDILCNFTSATNFYNNTLRKYLKINSELNLEVKPHSR